MTVVKLVRPALLTAGLAFLIGCQKEVLTPQVNENLVIENAAKKEARTHKLKGEITGTWNIMGLPTIIDYYIYGKGTSNINILGKSTSYYNTLSTWPDTAKFIHAPIVNITEYHSELSSYLDLLSSKDASVISLDKQGNSFISKQVVTSTEWGTYSGYTDNVTDPVQIHASYQIVGGTGKFAGATGSFVLSGYWTRTNYGQLSGPTTLFLDGEIIFKE